MGCDIHAWVDYDSGRGSAWTVAALHLDRDYNLFAILAGVRNALPLGVDPGVPKGLPERLGSGPEYYLLDEGFSNKPHMIGKPFQREGWAGVYSWPPDEIVDHHSFSWLTADELAAKLDAYADIKNPFRRGGRIPEWDGVLGMMRAIDASGEGQSRLVFWFDN